MYYFYLYILCYYIHIPPFPALSVYRDPAPTSSTKASCSILRSFTCVLSSRGCL